MKNAKFRILAIVFLIAGATLFSRCDQEDGTNDPYFIPELIHSWKITIDGNNKPWGIAICSKGNVYTSELSGSRISKFTSTGTLITTWGTYGCQSGQFYWPKHIAVDKNDNIYVADEQNHRIQVFTSSGTFINQWGNGISEAVRIPLMCDPSIRVLPWAPSTVAVDILNNWVYVTDMSNRIQKFDLSGNFITHWGGTGTGDGQFRFLDQNDQSNQGANGQMAVDDKGNIYVVDNMNCRVQKFNSSGTFLTKWGSKGSGGGQFLFPCGIAIDNKNGFVYVSDNSTAFGGDDNIPRILKFDLSGTFIKHWNLKDQPGNVGFLALAVDIDGNVLAIEGSRVVKYALK